MLYYKRKTFLKQILEKPHRGNIRDVMIVALPMLLSMSFDTLMTFADRLFLAKLSPELMNAALAGGSAQVMVMTFFNGLIAYSTAQVAQNFGAKQFHNCSKSCTQAAILALVCTAPLCTSAGVYRCSEQCSCCLLRNLALGYTPFWPPLMKLLSLNCISIVNLFTTV